MISRSSEYSNFEVTFAAGFLSVIILFFKLTMNIQLRQFLVLNRLPLAVLLIGLGFLLGFKVTWWIAWIPFLVAIFMVVAHFLIGTMTLVQRYMENGEVDKIKYLLSKIKKPNWLYKPIRSSYYMLQANMDTASENLDNAEVNLRRSLESGINEPGAEGTVYLQLGFIALKKGNNKEAYEQLRKAVKLGLPDADHEAGAYLQLSNLAAQRREYKVCKQYFAKAKAAKATNKELLDQIREMQTYIARMPG